MAADCLHHYVVRVSSNSKGLLYILEGMFDRERLNSGTLTPGGKKEGYVMFGNDTIADKKLKLRVTCQDNIFLDDEIRTIKLYN